jgi:hypothetical protein
MGKKTAAGYAKASGKNRKPVKGNSFRLVKSIVLLVFAALALAAGIYKGGEGLFFGVVFALTCGLMGVLYLRQDSTPTNAGKR